MNSDTYIPTVYTFYDTDMHPLYVGKSYYLRKRLKTHQRENPNFSRFVYIGIQQYLSRVDADIAELWTIKEKEPLLNKDCNHRWDEPSDIVCTGLAEEIIMPVSDCLVFGMKGVEKTAI